LLLEAAAAVADYTVVVAVALAVLEQVQLLSLLREM
jgi:hypothetical protein